MGGKSRGVAPTDLFAWRFLRTGARALARQRLELHVAGREHVPARGPVLIAARHYHHLYDGVALVTALDRPLHIVVGLDWVRSARGRQVMDLACGAARWPVVFRPDALERVAPGDREERAQEMRRLLRVAAAETVALLQMGRIVVVFPEGYPNVDPGFTPKRGDEFLPFQPGVIQLARLAEDRGSGPVAIIPAGFHEQRQEGGRWRVYLRFGEPVERGDPGDDRSTLAVLERAVRRLSAPPDAVRSV